MPADAAAAPARAEPPLPRAPGMPVLAALAGAVVVLDQITKAFVHRLLPLYHSVEIVPGLLDFTYVRNTGIAFGFLNTTDIPLKTLVMTAVALASMGILGLFASRTRSHERLTRIGLALVFGGAAGNLIDRVRMGFVVDFVDAHWMGWHFWTFNVADAAITAGACLMLLEMTVLRRHVSTPS